jgi:uncharacterized membrane protein (DUF106 family)
MKTSVHRLAEMAYTGSAKKMYTHCNRWYLCIVFEVELQYVGWCFLNSVATRMTVRSCDV